MSYRAAIDYLYGLRKYGIKLGLEKTEAILSLIANPHRQFRCIHIAGTNGKGSVSAMVASILSARGFRVGLFTSPHLLSFTERITVDGKEISEPEVVGLTGEIRSRIAGAAKNSNENLDPTFFEFVTAMAFAHFARGNVDWAVIETGMGGRLDATNVVTPEVSVITSISYDHREFLGEGLSEIAGEKAGIIKEGIPVVSALQKPEVAEVIDRVAREKSAPLFIYGKDFKGVMESSGIEGNRFDYFNGSSSMGSLYIRLAGEHQVMNASLAIKAVTIALEKSGKNSSEARNCGSAETKSISEEAKQAVRAGLAATRLRGRLERVSIDPPVIIDGAHNVEAAEAVAGFIRKYLAGRKIVLVLGIMADKDVSGILDALLPVASETILTAPEYSRAESPHNLAERAASAGFSNILVAPTVKDAVAAAKGRQAALSGAAPAVIVITGSFYTSGEAMEALGERAMLSTLRETA